MKFFGDYIGFFMGKDLIYWYIVWYGVVFFEMCEERFFDIWVLGDVKVVE